MFRWALLMPLQAFVHCYGDLQWYLLFDQA